VLLDAAKKYQTQLLIHPTVGSTKPGDTHYFQRVRCYESILTQFPLNIAMLSLMPYSMRMAGPRETLLLAIVHQNYGCSHFLVGPNHSSPLANDQTTAYYDQYAAQQFVANYQQQLAIKMVAVEEYQYQSSRGKFQPKRLIKQNNEEGHQLTETEFRRRLHEGIPIPDWFSFPSVINELKTLYKPRSEQGFTIFFTGLSGSGKSTLAKIVYAKLIEHGHRPVTLLDGDVVRLNLSSELGFSKPHRDLNIRRIGFVSSEISKNGGIAICAPIAPYTQGRRAVR
jgi:sulfate adenylyltransferase